MHILTMKPDAEAANEAKKFLSSLTWEKVLPAIIILVVGFLVIRLLMFLFNKALERSKLERAAHGMLRCGMRILLNTILILTAISSLGVNVSGLVAVVGVVSLALSLAVQGALSNVVGGITLLSTHPFKSGDYVEIGSLSGTVQEVNMAYTQLQTPDNKTIYIPNSTAASAQITNYSAQESRRVDITVSASYDSPTEDVRKALLEAANIPETLFTPEPFVGIQSYGDSAITYILRVWTSADAYWNVYYTINENIRKEFNAAGVEMCYPHLNVHLDK